MERDSGEAKQSNSYQKKYSNFKYLSGLISCQLIDQYSQSIKHHSDFNWFRFSEVNKFVEDNVHGETIRPIQLNHSLQTPSFPTLVSFLFNY